MPVVNYTTINGQIVCENRGGVKTLFMPDTLGNVIETRNMDTGAQTSSTTYWPYGEVRTQTGTNPSPFGFCGVWGYYTQAGQPTYVRARYYRPHLGRWQNVDPLWPIEAAYGYVDQSPLQFSDIGGSNGPSRKQKCDSLHDECIACSVEHCIDGWRDFNEGLCTGTGAAVGSSAGAGIGGLVGGPWGAGAGGVVGGIVGGSYANSIFISENDCFRRLEDVCNHFKRDCNERWYVFCDAIARKRCRGEVGPSRDQCLKSSFAACRRSIGNGSPSMPLPPPIQPRPGGPSKVIGPPEMGWPSWWKCEFNKNTRYAPRLF